MSTLKGRLRLLKAQRQGAGDNSSAATAPALADRVQRLRVAQPVREGGADVAGLARQLDAELLAPGLLHKRSRFPLGDRHGRQALQALRRLPQPCWLMEETADVERFLFIDTETTGLAGGTGTVAFMVAVGRVQGEAFLLDQYLLAGFSAEQAMLTRLAAGLSGDEWLVSFNGRSFDLPLLATRFRLTGQADPFAALPHLDLLAPVRRLFRGRWPDCRLQTAEKLLLDFAREDDLPGALAPWAWQRWLQHGEGDRLADVLRHNALDVLSLAALIPALAVAGAAPHRFDGNVLAMARGFHQRGDEGRARELLERGLEQDALDAPAIFELARLRRRGGDWSGAKILWQRLADGGDPLAVEMLAKYYEHRENDYAKALECCRRLHEMLPGERAIRHRRQRLLRKLACAERGAVPGQQMLE